MFTCRLQRHKFLLTQAEIMTNVILITGVTSGIGKALCHKLLENDNIVIGIGRSLPQLENIKEKYERNFSFIQADLSDNAEWNKITNYIINNKFNITHIVNNAGELNPICKIDELEIDAYRYQHTVNVEAPLFLTQNLLPLSAESARFMFITSGAAFNPYKGLASYSISKAATNMIWQTYKIEYADKPYYFCGVRPGGVKTKMLVDSLVCEADTFPAVTEIKRKIANNEILEPEYVASFLEWILLYTDNEKFEQGWNIKDKNQYDAWQAWNNSRNAT